MSKSIQSRSPIAAVRENSPSVEVDSLQESLIETVENSSGVEVDPLQESLIETAENFSGVKVDPVSLADRSGARKFPGVEVDPVSESFIETVETSLAAFVEQVQEEIQVQAQEPIEEHFDIEELFERESSDCPACGGINSLYAVWSQEYINSYWNIYCQHCQSSCCTDQLPHYLQEEDSRDSEIDRYVKSFTETEPTSASGLAAKNLPDSIGDK